ncbi:MAG: NmrA family NAD(P)-binding protein [Bdellovibrionales bacterium]
MITVLGATGNVGSKIANLLLERQHKVRAVGRQADKLDPLQQRGAEIATGNIIDVEFLTRALKGSSSAFVMIPPDYTAKSFARHYESVSEAIARAIPAAGVSHIVNLSSFGAELESGTGPIKSLHRHEMRLNQLTGTHILHLRPTYFFENLLMNLPLIRSQSLMGSAISADLRFPMIATADIAEAAASALAARDFKGHSVRELLGPRDISLNEAALLVSEAIGRPVNYVAFDYVATKGALVEMGLSPDTADQFVEMSQAFNSGLISTKGKRNSGNTTPTDFREFAQVFRQLV